MQFSAFILSKQYRARVSINIIIVTVAIIVIVSTFHDDT